MNEPTVQIATTGEVYCRHSTCACDPCVGNLVESHNALLARVRELEGALESILSALPDAHGEGWDLTDIEAAISNIARAVLARK